MIHSYSTATLNRPSMGAKYLYSKLNTLKNGEEKPNFNSKNKLLDTPLSKEEIELNNKFNQINKYLKNNIEEKTHQYKGLYNFNQFSKNSNQKSTIMKSEEKNQNVKVTFQQILNFDDKYSTSEIPKIILSDKDDSNLTNEEKLKRLIKILENYKDTIHEREYCKNFQDRLSAEIYIIFSQISLNLFNGKDDEPKTDYLRNYLKKLSNDIKYDLINEPNSTLNYINHNLIDIRKINEEFYSDSSINTTIINDEKNYIEYDEENNDSELSDLEKFLEEEKNDENLFEKVKNSTKKNQNSIIECVEINESEQNKLIFAEEKKKENEIQKNKANFFTYEIDKKYLQNNQKIKEIRDNAFEDIIDIINTESVLLPKSRTNLALKDIKNYIKQKKIKLENKNEISKNKISILQYLDNFSDEDSNDSLNSENNHSFTKNIKKYDFQNPFFKKIRNFFEFNSINNKFILNTPKKKVRKIIDSDKKSNKKSKIVKTKTSLGLGLLKKTKKTHKNQLEENN